MTRNDVEEAVAEQAAAENSPTKFTESVYSDKIYLEEKINPDEYIVGPDDVFSMNLLATDGMLTYLLKVSPTGDVLIPAIGKVNVDKKTLSAAWKEIEDTCNALYPNASVYITLESIRSFKIKVIGSPESPGFMVVNPLTRVSDIYREINPENVNENISLRNIKLHRLDSEINIDLLKYHMFGDIEMNPKISAGDIITIGRIDEEIEIYGGVQLPGKYEFVDNESLGTLIKLAGGLTPEADSKNIEITRFINDTEKIIINIENMEMASNTILHPEDFIIVRYKKDYKRQDIVTIQGEVKFPGRYSIDTGLTTIGDVIERAGGYSSRSDVSKISVNNMEIQNIVDIELERVLLIPNEDRSDAEKAYLKARSRMQKGQIVSASTKFTDIVSDFPVQREDIIYVPAIQEYVEILGAVLHPGRYPLLEHMDYLDYIDKAGGLTDTATRKKYIIKHSTGQRIPLKQSIEIENGDVIFVAEKLEYNKWERFKDIMAIGGQMAAIIIVIQNAIAN